ncbi:hypothetical protein CPB84DRAFT_1775407, partial [Gymnopilus junonius]
NIFMQNGHWPGAAPQICVMLKVPMPLSQMIAGPGPVYYIYNCATNRALCRNIWDATQVVLHDSKKSKFTFKLQKDHSLCIRSEFDKKYIGNNFELQDAEHSFRFIRSVKNKDWFFICSNLNRYRVLHDADCKSIVSLIGINQYKVEWTNLDLGNTRQLWRLELVQNRNNRSRPTPSYSFYR